MKSLHELENILRYFCDTWCLTQLVPCISILFIYGLSTSRSVACKVKHQKLDEMYAITSGALLLLCSQDLKFLNNIWEEIEYFKRRHGIQTYPYRSRGVTLTPHPFQCRGQERVELYLYSTYGPYGQYRASVPVQGCTLPLPLPLPYRSRTFRDVVNKEHQNGYVVKVYIRTLRMIIFDARCSVLNNFFSLSCWLTENSLSKLKKRILRPQPLPPKDCNMSQFRRPVMASHYEVA